MNQPVMLETNKPSERKENTIFSALNQRLKDLAGEFFSTVPIRVLTAITPTHGMNISQDLRYGIDSRHTLDVYQPVLDSSVSGQNSHLPVIVFIHGGSWQSGDKKGYGFVGKSLAQAGYVAVVMEYRLAPKNIYPDYVIDAVSAIAWVYQHIAQYGGNPNEIFVMGHSAGAFNAIAAVDDARYWNPQIPISAIKAVIGLAGPYSYDFRKFDSRIAFPTDMTPEDVMPDSHIRPDAPPHLLLIAKNDKLVGIKNMLKMKRGLERANIPVETDVIPKVNHISMIIAMASSTAWMGDTRQMVLDYMARQR